MFVSRLLLWIIEVLHMAISAYTIVIIAHVVMSWVSADRYNPIVRFIARVSEPVLRPIRYRMPDFGGLDLSPMIVIFALQFVDRVVLPSFADLALGLR